MTVSKIVAAAASGAGSDPIDVDDVFNTFVWEGTGSAKTITNNIDLSGEGGLVWVKKRSGSSSHTFQDTARGATKHIRSNADSSEATEAQTITAFNSNGFTLGTDDIVNASGSDYAGWTFRKSKKFFDVVTYTGTGSTRTLSHNLDCEIGQIWIKCTSSAYDWNVFSKGVAGYMSLRLTDGEAGSTGTTFFNNATTTQFTLTGGGNTINASGETYVAYLFAHNNNNGTFGPDGDQDIIKVGTYTGDGNATGALQNLGFEPQFVIIKNTNLNTERWHVYDHTRGMHHERNDYYLMMDVGNAELNHETIQPEPTGFRPMTSDDKTNGSGRSYLYMAIRRGPLAVPDDATKVFHPSTYVHPDNNVPTGFDADLNINALITSGYERYVLTKMLSHYNLQANTNLSETNQGSGVKWFDTNSNTVNLDDSWWSTNTNLVSWSWRLAPSYLDIRAYVGTGSARTITHGLGVQPEMIWIKRRDSGQNWGVYHKGLNSGTDPEDYALELNSTSAEFNVEHYFNDTAPTSSVFTVGTHSVVNYNTAFYVAYLFATAPGVSKVGSYTGDDTDGRVIDCGFSSGARFILHKCVSHSQSWFLFDSARGIVAGNDSRLKFDTSEAVNTSYDYVDPSNSGFIVNNTNGDLNSSGRRYIFYAVA